MSDSTPDTFREQMQVLAERATAIDDPEELLKLLRHELIDTVRASMATASEFHRAEGQVLWHRDHPRQDLIDPVIRAVLSNPSFIPDGIKNIGVINMDNLTQDLSYNPSLLFAWATIDSDLLNLVAYTYTEVNNGNPLKMLFGTSTDPLSTEIQTEFTPQVADWVSIALESHVGPMLLKEGSFGLPPYPRGRSGQLVPSKMSAWRSEARAALARVAITGHLTSATSLALHETLGTKRWFNQFVTASSQKIKPHMIWKNATPHSRWTAFQEWFPAYLAMVKDIASMMGKPMPRHLLSEVFP